MKPVSAIVSVFFFLILLLLPCWTNAKQHDVAIERLVFEQQSEDEERLVVVLQEELTPRIFRIDGEKPRIVIDLPSTRYHGENVITLPEANLARKIRVGSHDDPVAKTRIVLDLVSNIPVRYQQQYSPETRQLKIILTSGLVQLKQSGTIAPDKRNSEDYGVKEEQSSPEKGPQPDTDELVAADEPADEISASEQEIDEQKAAPSSPSEHLPEAVQTAQDGRADVAVSGAEQISPSGVEDDGGDSQDPPGADFAADDVLVSTGEVESLVPPDLVNITFDRTSGEGEMVKFHLNDYDLPRVSVQEQEQPRIYCDFTNPKHDTTVEETILPQGDFVRKIHIETRGMPELLRVVIDLVPGKNYDLRQVLFKADRLFVLVITELEPEFQRE
ncbi:AMIN domain-containing protein [Desulforhopalus singaporensis]|uniref:AMIN domain-containing protein n=1 Tax=Desulforhopalus singaporensis TaxID=91360 RepID=A0A1H0MHM8_9BACT|nr:AMIN domain-containing protein [Desulforhopalus singaporensis]SDO79871.1 AMIN domain-containing protein [Desulforhopalus singaporensis]